MPTRTADDTSVDSAPLLRLVTVCSLTLVMGTSLQSSLVPLLPRFADEHALTASQLAVIAGAYSVGILAAAIPTAKLVGRHGAKPVLSAAVAALVVSALVLVVDDGPSALMASRFIQGLAGCMVWGAAFPWVAEMTPAHRRGQLLGVLLSAGVAGGLVGPVVPLVAGTIGSRPTFAALALGSTLTLLACLRLPAPPRHPGRRKGVGRPRLLGWTVVVGGWLVVLVGMIVGMSQVLGALRMDSVGAGTTVIAALMVTATACQAALSPLAGLASDRLGPTRPIQAGLVVLACVLVGFTAPVTSQAQFVVILLTLCTSTLVWGPAVALMSSAARSGGVGQGAVFAVVNLAWAIGTLVGTAGSGLVSTASAAGTATSALGAVALVSVGVVALLRRDQVSQSR
jgi:predicted MFS family arabinose efflux permease